MKVLYIFAVLLFTYQPLSVRSVHSEVKEAQGAVDSLSIKLHQNLTTLQNIYERTKHKIHDTLEELVIVKKVQTLLAQLGKDKLPEEACEHRYVVPDFKYKRNIMIESQSELPAHYTISVQVNHKALVEEKKASANGEDLRVFFHSEDKVLPIEIDRIVTDLQTSQATVQFRLQKMIPANKVDGKTYALVFGSKAGGKAKANPEMVFAFYDDFSNSTLSRWKRVWGDWTVKNGTVFGKTGASAYGKAEVGLYVKEGTQWTDVELELDLMETGTGVVYPGPFMRVQDSSLQHTTAWWFEYWTDHKECTMRPFINNKDGLWKYKAELPENFVKNNWYHFKYRLQGNKISQWVNEERIQNATVASEWMIPKGTVGFGCHEPRGEPFGCQTFYDNVKVRLIVASSPRVSTGSMCRLTFHKELPVGEKDLPADSCKQIYDADNLKKSGVYWIKTALKGNQGTQTFCDMDNGGWTLVGKVSGRAGNIYSSWLVENVDTEDLMSPEMVSDKNNYYACLDSRAIAVKHASEVMFSSGDNPNGIGSKWVKWELPGQREYDSWWNHKVGYNEVHGTQTSQVTVEAWDGKTKICYQNKFGIMPLQQHGGSYPYASANTQGNTEVNDLCMAVGVQLSGATADGWSQNANGYDSPRSDSDWPNRAYNHQSPHLDVWLK